MDYQEFKEDLHHVNVVVATPYSANENEIRHGALRENLQFMMEGGIRSFIPVAGTGEFYSLTMDERANVVQTTVETVGADGRVTGYVGGCLPEALELVERYENAGADGILIAPATHVSDRNPHQKFLLEYYRTIAESTTLGVAVYRRNPLITDEMLTELAELDNLVAVKYHDDVSEFTKTAVTLPEASFEGITWVSGRGELHAPSYAFEGAYAFTTSIANFVPEVSVALFEAMRDHEWDRAKRIREAIRPFLALRDETGADNSISGANHITAIKYGMELAGIYGGPVRKPLQPELSDADKTRARKEYDRIQQLNI